MPPVDIISCDDMSSQHVSSRCKLCERKSGLRARKLWSLSLAMLGQMITQTLSFTYSGTIACICHYNLTRLLAALDVSVDRDSAGDYRSITVMER